MAAKITGEIVEAYVSCKTKAYLKLQREQGTRTDYDVLRSEMRERVRRAAQKTIEAAYPEGEILQDVQAAFSVLKRGAEFLQGRIEDASLQLTIDGFRKTPGACALGDFHYVPAWCYEGERIRQDQRQLVALLGIVLGDLQERQPAIGLVYHGRECRVSRVQLTDALQKKASRILLEIRELHRSGGPPRLTLNSHCRMCEFRQRCHEQAMKDDDLSLLTGMGEKEIRKYNGKGIFTTTQLSCTFRLRKRGKRVQRVQRPHYFALRAAAKRDQKVYVLEPPSSPASPVEIYLDAEGDLERSFVYLLSMLVVENGADSWHSLWADSRDQELDLFKQFLDLVRKYDDYVIFHYGSYETSFFKRMQKALGRTTAITKLMDCSCNVLSIIHSHIYFPLFSNGLKDVGRYLGFDWSDPKADGLQSIFWRERWEETGDIAFKRKLETYNREDCLALRRVVVFLREACATDSPEDVSVTEDSTGRIIEAADRINPPIKNREFRTSYASPDLDYVNKCAYFDHQRDKVFLRTNSTLRRIQRLKHKGKRARKPRINRTIDVKSRKCPQCGSMALVRHHGDTHTKLAYDLKLSGAGIARQVIECTAARHECTECMKQFLPVRYKRRAKYFHSFQAWAMYQHVVHRMSYQRIEEMILDCFAVPISYSEIYMFKPLLARYYQRTYKQIISSLTSGMIIHADETQIKLQKGKGYVWILANMENVAYVYRSTREGAWIHELLRDFEGVLITDFYSAYDSIECEQQKCLIHLIRDMNHALLGRPYDEDFKWLVSQFGAMLRLIISSVDRYGLKRRNLKKHLKDVDRFYRVLADRSFSSDLANDFQKRLMKCRTKLFTFLRHDGVPWNNNNAEHAVKHFAHYRANVDGQVTEGPLQEYLVLLTIFQTCKYRGTSFLRFLLSGEKDIDAFRDSGRPTPRKLSLQVYPGGISNYYRSPRKRKEKPSG